MSYLPRALPLLVLVVGALFLSPESHTAAQVCVPILDHIEITQVIQHDPCAETGVPPCTPPPESELIPLVDGKPLTTRLYVKPPAGCPDQDPLDPNTDARLAIYDDGSPLFEYVWFSDNGPIAAHGPAWEREDEQEAINFTFFLRPKAGATSRELSFRACVGLGQTAYDVGSTCEWSSPVTRTFEKRAAPLLKGVKVVYHGVEPHEANIVPGVGDQFIWASNPFPKGQYELLREPGYPPVEWTVDDGPYNAGGVLSRVQTYYDERGLSGYLYGWVPHEATGPRRGLGGVGGRTAIGGSGTATYGRKTARWTYTHELGHNFGFLHMNEEAYDETIQEIGWDAKDVVGVGRPKPESNWDRMSYMGGWDTIWINFEAYTDSRLNLGGGEGGGATTFALPGAATTDSTKVGRAGSGVWTHPSEKAQAACHLMGQPGEPTDFVAVPVKVMPGGAWSIEHTFRYASVDPRTDPQVGGNGLLRVLDDQGGEFHSTGFSNLVHCEQDPACGSNPYKEVPARIRVPSDPRSHAIEIYKEGQLQDVITRTANAPVVNITSPLPGATLDENTVVTWTATDADGDQLQAYVVYSHDGGETLTPLSLTIEGIQQVELTPEYIPGGTKALIRVVVSDGMNITEAEVGGLQFDTNWPPQAYISTPEEGAHYRQHSMVMLIGTAYDPEDGEIPESEMEWYSDLDGNIGQGYALNVHDLSAGTHVIEFRAADSDGAEASDYVTISIAP